MRHKVHRMIESPSLDNLYGVLRAGFHMASQSLLVLTAATTVVATSGFVAYKDWLRYRRMLERFASGCIIEPLGDKQHQVKYHSRPQDQEHLMDILKSEVSNQYYLIYGEVGTGKTRLVTEVIGDLMKTDGKLGLGAPVYVMASQGISFPDSFANAVNYHFDEHLSFRFVIDFIIRVGEMPKKDEKTKLERVLSSIEKAAYLYLKKTGKPVVIVIDNVSWITESMPGALERIQEKAKLWADTNIAKVVLVSNDEKTEEILQMNHSAWARGALPVVIGDLSPAEAKAFLLLKDPIIERFDKAQRSKERMNDETIDKIIDLVGGRLQHLLICKIEWAEGKDFDLYTSTHLRLKERTKFYEVVQVPTQRRVIETLWKCPGRTTSLRRLTQSHDRDDVQRLAWENIIKLDLDKNRGLMVKFQSRLTENVVAEMMQNWEKADSN